MNKVGQQEQCVAAQCRPHKNISECEKWDGKEERVVAFRCVNYAKMPGTWRWVLLASICAPSVPALHRPPLSQSTNQQQVLKDQARVFVCFIQLHTHILFFFLLLPMMLLIMLFRHALVPSSQCRIKITLHFQSSIGNRDANDNYKLINHC